MRSNAVVVGVSKYHPDTGHNSYHQQVTYFPHPQPPPVFVYTDPVDRSLWIQPNLTTPYSNNVLVVSNPWSCVASIGQLILFVILLLSVFNDGYYHRSTDNSTSIIWPTGVKPVATLGSVFAGICVWLNTAIAYTKTLDMSRKKRCILASTVYWGSIPSALCALIVMSLWVDWRSSGCDGLLSCDNVEPSFTLVALSAAWVITVLGIICCSCVHNVRNPL